MLVPVSGAALAELRNSLIRSTLPQAGIDEQGRQFFAGQVGGRIVGFIGLEVYGGRCSCPVARRREVGARQWLRPHAAPERHRSRRGARRRAPQGTPYDELSYDDPALTDDQLIDAMIAHPILDQPAAGCHPARGPAVPASEVVLDILPTPQRGAFTKEGGGVVVDAPGQRVC